MDSRQRERQKAETTLKEGAAAANAPKETTQAPNAAEAAKKWLPHTIPFFHYLPFQSLNLLLKYFHFILFSQFNHK